MSLLHPALLFGLALAAIPILLHLLLKAKPKRLIFPALRLIQQNRRQNVRRLQLRHLWLLLLRIFVIALIVIAVTRPSLPAANYSLQWYEWATLIVVIGLGIGCYFGIMAWWQRQALPRQQLLTRRTMLRGGVGGATALLLLLALGWPYARRVSAEIKDPAPRVADNTPVAAIFLFDTSPSMSYREENQTRLQLAQQIGRDHLSGLPAGSKVAVAGSSTTASSALPPDGGREAAGQEEPGALPAFSLDLQAARSRIDALDIRPAGRSLNERLRNALQAQDDDRRRVTAEQGGPEEKRQDRFLREIYLFTDLAKSAWRDEKSTLLRDELERLKQVGIYVIDVGEQAPSNVAITSVKPSRETMPVGSSLRIDVSLSSIGRVKPEQTIEFLLSEPGGKPVKMDQQTTTLEPGVEQRLTFQIPRVTGRYQQGEFRIVGSDPLTIDDVGYFTVQTLPQLKVLIVAETSSVARYWKLTLDYLASEKTTDFKTEFLSANRLRDADLKPYDVVCLINVSSPDEDTWQKLHGFVEAGGGLGVFLGADNAAAAAKRSDRIDPVAYNGKAGQSVLPAELTATVSFRVPQSMDLRNSPHPLLKRLEDFGALTELGAIEVFKGWNVSPQESAIVVARFNGPRALPALIERRLGQGRVMLMTTSVDNQDWNALIGTPWYFAFCDQLVQYLSRQASVRCNEIVGSEVSLPLDRDRKLKKVVLRMPDFKQRTQDVPVDSKQLSFRDLVSVGSYQVDSADAELDYHVGFSLNLPARESDLRRLEPRDLDSLLGEGRYSMSRDPKTLVSNVLKTRLGQEAYGMVVAFLIAVFAMEQFTATWFYRTDEA